MKRGFQIWPQISNPISFDPFFGQKTLKLAKYASNCTCGQFFFRKRFFLVQIRNQRPKSHNNSWFRDRFAEKMVITTHPTVYELCMTPKVASILGGRVVAGAGTGGAKGTRGQGDRSQNGCPGVWVPG